MLVKISEIPQLMHKRIIEEHRMHKPNNEIFIVKILKEFQKSREKRQTCRASEHKNDEEAAFKRKDELMKIQTRKKTQKL